MRTLRANRRAQIGFNMTPMIDVVFLLIIFFLVSSHLARQENQMPLPLPKAESASDLPADQSPRVILNVLGSGEIRLSGRSVDLSELSRRLQRELERVGNELEVRIRSDRHVPYRFVGSILTVCSRVGIWNVTFSVVRGE